MYYSLLPGLRVCTSIVVFLFIGQCSFAQLSGTYVVDAGGGGDYTTFGAAFTALESQGVSGPVIMEVATGNYNSRASLSNIPGSSIINSITFRGQALDSSLAVWSYGAQATIPWLGHNSLLRLDGAQFVTFEHLTLRRLGTGQFANVIHIEGSTSNITVQHCRLSGGYSPTGTTAARNVVYNDDLTAQPGMVFRNNRIEGGNLGFYWDGNTRLDEVELEGNVINSPRNYIESVGGSVTVNGNLFYTTLTWNALYLRTMSCPVQVRDNVFRSTTTTTTVYMYGVNGLPTAPVVFAGNMAIGQNYATEFANCDFVDMVHNSFSGAVRLTSANNDIRSWNNIFRSTTGYAMTIGSGNVSASDHNCYFSASGNGVSWSGAHNGVASLNAATGMDANSRFLDPEYVNPLTDLHLQSTSPCVGIGLPIVGEVSDIDAEPRPQPALSDPDIGADETIELCIPLNGTYTIGPSVGTDFATFGAAINKISGCGVGGAVVFEVEDGTYTERLEFVAIPGSSTSNTVTFRSASLDSSSVTIRYAASNSATNNYVVDLNGVAHLQLTHMTFDRYGSSTYRRVVQVSPDAGSLVDVVIDRSELTSFGFSGTSAELIGRTNGSGVAHLQVTRTLLRGGSFAMDWDANGAADELTVSEGKVEGGTNAIHVQDVSGSVNITKEEISLSSGTGVYLYDCTGAISITKNHILSTGSGSITGIYYRNNNPALPDRSLVANNEIIIYNGDGIRLLNSNSRMDLVHNSVAMGALYRVAFDATGSGTDVNVLNNVFWTLGSTPADIAMTGLNMDHNCFYGVNGPTRVRWGTDHTDIPALFGASGTNANSVFADPRFFNGSDLHAYGMDIDAAATPFAPVPEDIDGEPRDPSTPDMGCDEFQPQLWNEAFNSCGASDPITSNGSGADQWFYKDRKVVARFNDNGQNLGTVNLNVYLNNAAVRQSFIGQYYMDRNWHLSTQNAITGPTSVRLFFSGDEFSTYATVDPIVATMNDAGVAHYAGLNENCDLIDNAAGSIWTPLFPAPNASEPRIMAPGGTAWYSASLSDDGELYITTMGGPLPVELLTFTGDRISGEAVQLDWSTASERDNDRFEIRRMVDGEEAFVEVGRVQGHGNSQQVLRYMFTDPNPTERVSYYKLRQIDHDGSVTDSKVIAVAGRSAGPALVVYPVPARERLNVNVDRSQVTSFELFDSSGRLQRQWKPNAELRVDDVPHGAHVLKVQMSDGSIHRSRCMIE
jgi:hypothetical protein